MNKSLATTFFERAELLCDKEAVRFKENKSPYKSMTWTALALLVKEMAAGLTARGVKAGDRVAILSQTSHLWAAADLATISSGGVTVPIYPTSSQSDIDFILSNSGSKVVFVHGEQLLKKVLASKQEALTTIVLISQLNKGRSLCEFLTENDISSELVVSLEELRQIGLTELEKNPAIVSERIEKIAYDDMATIIYTSGTTGTPKGVPLTHGNIVSVLDQLKGIIPIDENDVYLSYLPMSHVFERVCGEYYWIYSGGVCAYAEGIETMAKNMAVPPIRGATRQRPPILAMSRVWMRSCRPPTRMKSAPVERAWHTSCRTTPCSASSFQAKTPIRTKPMWLTLV